MKIRLLFIGKTNEKYLSDGISKYSERLKHYSSFETKEISAIKSSSSTNTEILKQKEGEQILKEIKNNDFIILLDERGKEFSSEDFAKTIQQYMNQSVKQIVFVIGGAYGFSDEVYKRASGKLSLSKMTFSHQLVRLIFLEQLYRSFTIIKGEKYHHS